MSQVNWINVLLLIVLTSFATMFAVANVLPVEIHFLGFSSSPLPVYVPIFVALLIGFAGGVLALSFSRRKHKQEIAQLRQENQSLHSEVTNLRNIPLQEDL